MTQCKNEVKILAEMVRTQLLTLSHDEVTSKTGKLIKPWFLICQMGLVDWMNTKDASNS